GSEEGLEDASQHAFRHAMPGVFEGNADVWARYDAVRKSVRIAAGQLGVRGADGDPPPVGHRVPRVYDEVEHHLLQLSRVHADGGEVRGGVHHQLDLLPDQSPHDAMEVGERAVEIDHF